MSDQDKFAQAVIGRQIISVERNEDLDTIELVLDNKALLTFWIDAEDGSMRIDYDTLETH